jgi:hypothetical protein
MAYEQDARQMLINRLRNVYEEEGEGITGGQCPPGYVVACRNKKNPGKVLKADKHRNYLARVRYHMKKGLSKRQAEIRASKPARKAPAKKAPAKKAPARKAPARKAPVKRHPAYGKPCKDFKGATATRDGCIPAPKKPRSKIDGRAQWQAEVKYQLKKHPGISATQAAQFARNARTFKKSAARKSAGKGLRYNPNYGGPGHMDGAGYGGIMMDSDYGGVLLDAFYNM